MEWRVPLADIDLGLEEEEAVIKVLRSRWLSMGTVTQQFEQEFADYINASYAFAVANGTAALHIACLAAGLGPGDEAIVPSLTFVATANAVRYTGATPVFADISSENDLTISPDSIENKINDHTRAIVVMHYGGYPCDMHAILSIAEKYHLNVIEDAAHSPGSSLEDRMLGTWGDVGCFSFFSNKNLATGEGGMVVTNNQTLAEKIRLLRSHGMTSLTWDRHQGHAWSYDVVELGYNYRLDEIRSAIGRIQLQKLTANNHRRRELTALYRDLLSERVPEVQIPFEKHPGTSSAHLMPILLPKGCDRLAFMESMKSEGIQTSIHYPPIHGFRAYGQKNNCKDLTITEDIAIREVTLPLFPTLMEQDIALVVNAVDKSMRNA